MLPHPTPLLCVIIVFCRLCGFDLTSLHELDSSLFFFVFTTLVFDAFFFRIFYY